MKNKRKVILRLCFLYTLFSKQELSHRVQKVFNNGFHQRNKLPVIRSSNEADENNHEDNDDLDPLG